MDATQTRPKRMPREVRERQMLDAAVAVFARRGYRAASMDEIAELAGASKPLVYLYLHSKEDLFSACIRREAEALISAVRGAVDRGAPADRRLWDGLRGFFAHTAAHPDGWAVLHCQARTHGEPFALEVAALRQQLVDVVTRLITETAEDGGCTAPLPETEVSGLAHALVGAAESLAGWSNERDGAAPSERETAATLMNFAWSGLENLANGRRWAPVGA
ncbi:TetR family transcriptional regulator [Streptomyces sp. NRRL B-1677]|uniref:TetR/AcrR family transcriptional regulator n=1 Tax=Streptomyces klenkii TaxID=1420899 RepID=A0A3B0BE89_9ACTN|nr:MULTISPECIES: TetR/AcrR family transcriptional regulator [Streptomyces]MBF6045109.1 TetR family transcriptional regulator [Streptomyces sp. NRRL B-1677]RKN70771.1 TetR/AcrR family transcriptional regulator [Streptomyces klenkii]